MAKNKTIILYTIFILSWSILVIFLTSFIYRRKIAYLEEENKYILEWVSNRHGKEWAERIKEWSHHKVTQKNLPPLTPD